jgi:virulence-associated protein VapD
MNINSADLIKNFERAANEKGVYLNENGDCVTDKNEKGNLSQLNKLIRNLAGLLINSTTGKSDIEKLMGYYKILVKNDINQTLIKINKIKESILEYNQKDLEKSQEKLSEIKKNFQKQMKWFQKSLNEIDLYELTGQKDTLSFIQHLTENFQEPFDPKKFLKMIGQCLPYLDEKAPLAHVQTLVEKMVHSIEHSDTQNELLNQFLKWLDSELQHNNTTPLAEVSKIAEKYVYLIQQLELPPQQKEALLDTLFLLYHKYLDQQITVQANDPNEIKKIENEKQFYLKLCQKKTSLLSPIHPSIQATATIHILDQRLSTQLTHLPFPEHSPTLAKHFFIPIEADNLASDPHVTKIKTMDDLEEVRYDVLKPGETYAYYKTTTDGEKTRRAPEISREENYLKIINILTQGDSPFVVAAARTTLHHSLAEKTQEQQSIVIHKQVAIPDAQDWRKALFYLYQQSDPEYFENQFDIEKIQEAAILMGDTGQYDLHGKNGFILRDSKTGKIHFAFNDNGRSLTPTNFFFNHVSYVSGGEHYLPFRFAAMLTPICKMPLEKAVKEKSLEQLTDQRLEEIEDQLRGKGKIALLSLVRIKLNQLDESTSPESKQVIEKLKKLISTTQTLDHNKEEKAALEKEFWEIIKGKKSIEKMSTEFQNLLESNLSLINSIILELKKHVESTPGIITEPQINALMERLRKKRDVLQSQGEVSCLDVWKAQYPAFQLFLDIVQALPSIENKEWDIATDYHSFEFYLKQLKLYQSASYEQLTKNFDQLVKQAESTGQVIKYHHAINKYK